MAELSWSVFKFDQRMENWVSHARRKLKAKKRRRAADGSDDDGEGDSGDGDDRSRRDDKRIRTEAPHQEEEQHEKPRSYNTNDRVSLVDSEGRPMCHGTIVDDEPKLPTSGMEEHGDEHAVVMECNTGDFKLVRLQGLVK